MDGAGGGVRSIRSNSLPERSNATMYNGCLQQIEVGVRMQVKDDRRSFTMGNVKVMGEEEEGGKGRCPRSMFLLILQL